MENKTQVAVFGGGCFWCTEAIFNMLRGVVSVKSGYAGGNMENPSYEEVSRGMSGHAEVIRVEFDPSVIGYGDLLSVFFGTHDPTTPNQQGADRGPQYRSVLLTTSDAQMAEAKAFIKQLEDDHTFRAPIVTEVIALGTFYPAEGYHQKYYENNRDSNPYCQVVIDPKIAKLRKRFSQFLK